MSARKVPGDARAGDDREDPGGDLGVAERERHQEQQEAPGRADPDRPHRRQRELRDPAACRHVAAGVRFREPPRVWQAERAQRRGSVHEGGRVDGTGAAEGLQRQEANRRRPDRTRDGDPADEIRAVLAHIRDGDRQPTADFSIDANRVLVGARRARFGIELQIDPGINDRDDPRVVAGRWHVAIGRRSASRQDGMADLSGQHALAESSVARPQNRSAVVGEPDVTPSRGDHDVPGVQRSLTANDRVGFVSLRVERVQVLVIARCGRTALRH